MFAGITDEICALVLYPILTRLLLPTILKTKRSFSLSNITILQIQLTMTLRMELECALPMSHGVRNCLLVAGWSPMVSGSNVYT